MGLANYFIDHSIVKHEIKDLCLVHQQYVYLFLCFDMLRDTISLLCGIRRSSMDNEGDKVISGRSMNACTEGGSHR